MTYNIKLHFLIFHKIRAIVTAARLKIFIFVIVSDWSFAKQFAVRTFVIIFDATRISKDRKFTRQYAGPPSGIGY